jgi:methylglutaconyl-CoA hydratase
MTIIYQNDGKIGRITFDRPDAPKRFTLQMITGFIAALEDATHSGAAGLVIDANGNDFTLGRDQKETLTSTVATISP